MGAMKFTNLTTGDHGVLELIEKSGKSEAEMKGFEKINQESRDIN